MKKLLQLSINEILFVVGREVEFLYPSPNYPHVRLRMERKRCVVKSIRDLTLEPLDPLTLTIDPNRRRGRYLITMHDMKEDKEKQYYVDHAQPVVPAEKPYAVVLEDDDNSDAELVYKCDSREEAEVFCRDWEQRKGTLPYRPVIVSIRAAA